MDYNQGKNDSSDVQELYSKHMQVYYMDAQTNYVLYVCL